MTTNRPLRVFLCHSSADKPAVRELYQKLRAEPWIQPWLDEEELYPGQDWNMEIEKAVESADAIIVCLSKGSITKEGYVQRELRIVLDLADYKPEGTLFIIPIRLEECEPPRRLRAWQYADYFEGQRERGFQRLLVSLKRRADSLGLTFEKNSTEKDELISISKHAAFEMPLSNFAAMSKITLSNGMEFMCVPADKFIMGSNNGEDNEKPQQLVDISYDYWMARFPVTNEQYDSYATAKEINHPISDWQNKKDHPVVHVTWNDAMAYSRWLNDLLKTELPSEMIIRIPTESEWEKAARGTDGREYPWGNAFDKNKCNTGERGTTSVGVYSPRGDSPYGCADMVGNAWEWTHSLYRNYPYKIDDGREDEKDSGRRVLRGGSFLYYDTGGARCAYRYISNVTNFPNYLGFRLVLSQKFS